MTVDCSRATSNVDSRKVVHSIERNKYVSASLAGGCKVIIDGNGSFEVGSIYHIRLTPDIKESQETNYIPQTLFR